ncbi:hypothetical protein CKK33_10330 [Mucilaginibacter sp. MD40]|nr:hypothetical protein CKK33_10330 [Mucilaginibacter sp. MD40]
MINIYMSKQHKTIPTEPEEMPVHIEGPEIKQPTDPNIREIPTEAPDNQPPEITPDTPKPDEGVVHPG